jgi:hypothetical protein
MALELSVRGTQQPGRDLGPCGETELGQDAADMRLDGPLGQDEARCDLAIGLRVRDKLGDLPLADRER